MELCADSYATSDPWTKDDLALFVTLAAQGKGRHEIAELMNRPQSEIVRAALKYSLILPN
ncbi:MAG: hypothetical protein KJ072_21200 [Verrucomicrobia bacterium]|nr:hypothetical protein [Verrucomicrobiota bacterium]